MEQTIDLDAAAALLERRATTWRNQGCEVGPVTWADGMTFDNPITTDRSQVCGDYSVGLRVTHGTQEGAVILYAGGWCDLEYWSGDARDEPVDETPGWGDPLDLPAFDQVLDRLESLFNKVS